MEKLKAWLKEWRKYSLVIFGILILIAVFRPQTTIIQPEIIVLKDPGDVSVYYYSKKLIEYYKTEHVRTTWGTDSAWLTACVSEVLRWSRFLDVQEHSEIILTMFHCESWYNPESKNLDSIGISQARAKYEKIYRAVIEKKGVKLGPLTDPRTQIALGVACFKLKLEKAGGNPWKAVQLYNGSGKKAVRHRKKIKREFERIFR